MRDCGCSIARDALASAAGSNCFLPGVVDDLVIMVVVSVREYVRVASQGDVCLEGYLRKQANKLCFPGAPRVVVDEASVSTWRSSRGRHHLEVEHHLIYRVSKAWRQ